MGYFTIETLPVFSLNLWYSTIMSIVEQLKMSINQVLENIGIKNIYFVLEHPTDLSHGDYACNVAMVAAKQAGKNPRELAELVAGILQSQENDMIQTISVAGPGFINITLSQKFFTETHDYMTTARGKLFGTSVLYDQKKILVEHSSPNLFKPFHVGHMMNNAIGESLVRLMQTSGATVRTMSFPSDISLGIAKAIFILLEAMGSDFVPSDITVLGDAYVQGTKRYEEDESIHVRVKEIADNLYAQQPSPEWDVFVACKQFNIDYFEQVVARLGSHFDSYIYESEAGFVGKQLVLDHVPAVFTESEGAVVYIPGPEKKHISTLVFINSQGNPTYEAKDLGLLALKFEREQPDRSVFVTDYQQVPHFDAVLDAAQKITPDWNEKSIHISHGRMSFKGQKMSSRLGGVPLATDILDTVLQEVRERSGERDLDAETMDAIAIGAVKFAILRAKPGQNINFDPETSLSFEGDSGPYLQYTHARICSLLEKAKGFGMRPQYDAQDDREIPDLERVLYRFPEVIELAITDYAPQYVVTYLLQVAQLFNSYYAAHTIIDLENPTLSAHRLAIAESVKIVIHNGLWVLGIKAPENM